MPDYLSPVLNGVGVVAVFVWLLWMIAKGHLVTRREADAITARAEAAEKRAEITMEQNTELIEVARFGKSVLKALDEGAKAP